MTLVHVDLRRGNFANPSEGSIWVATVNRWHVNEAPDYIAVQDAVEYTLVEGQADIELRPSDVGNGYIFTEAITAGIVRVVTVPNSPFVVDYADLIDIDPTTLDPSDLPAWQLVLDQIVTLNANVETNAIAAASSEANALASKNAAATSAGTASTDAAQALSSKNIAVASEGTAVAAASDATTKAAQVNTALSVLTQNTGPFIVLQPGQVRPANLAFPALILRVEA